MLFFCKNKNNVKMYTKVIRHASLCRQLYWLLMVCIINSSMFMFESFYEYNEAGSS